MRHPPFFKHPVSYKILTLPIKAMEDRVAALIKLRWRECGYDVRIFQDGPWVRSDLVGGLPRDKRE